MKLFCRFNKTFYSKTFKIMFNRIKILIGLVIINLIAFSCNNESIEVPISNIELSASSEYFEVGLTDTLQLTINPQNASNKEFIWSSSNPSIAEVDSDGIVTGISPGEATISVSTNDKGFIAQQTVQIIRWTFYNMEDVTVRPIAVGLQDHIWAGGYDLTRIFDNSEQVYPDIKGISAIAGNNRDNIWFGSYNSGIWKFDGANWSNYTAENSNIDYDTVNYNSMVLDLEDNLWFGTVSKGKGTGVTMFDGNQWQVFNSDNGLVFNSVNGIAVDTENKKWFTTRQGISSFDGTIWVSYTSENTGIDLIDQVFSVAIDKENNKWFGSYGGALKFDGTNWTRYNSSPDVLKWNFINAIAIDKENNKWFATEYGVSKFDGTNWVNYNSKNSVNYDKVYNVRDIAIDSQGNKWLGTSYGVIKLED